MQKLKLIIPDMRKFFMSGIKTENTSCGMDMTSGSLWKKIFLFSIPLMMSQVLEVLFNMSDVAVVGKFASYEALGAVGSTTILVTLLQDSYRNWVVVFNVIVARQHWCKTAQRFERYNSNSIILCLIVGIIVSIICISCAHLLLNLLNTKEELIDGAMLYFRIYALGMPAMAVYNFGNAVMSAGGDTKASVTLSFIAGIVNVWP